MSDHNRPIRQLEKKREGFVVDLFDQFLAQKKRGGFSGEIHLEDLREAFEEGYRLGQSIRVP